MSTPAPAAPPVSVHEFACPGCGENTATLDPSLIECDDCRIAYQREEIPFPEAGDFCETCVVACDHCGAEFADQHMTRLEDGEPICPDCDDDHGPAAFARYCRALAAFNRRPATWAEFRRASRVSP